MRGPAVRPVVIAAGGTGGHFFPAEALAATLIARGHRVVLMTDARSGALKSSVFAGHEQYQLSGAGLAGRGLVRGMRAGAGLAAGIFQAWRVLRRLEPASIVAFGGYPSVPPVLAANLIRPRPFVVLQEQNAVLGRANRFLARRADLLALGVVGTRGIPASVRNVVVGNPVRPAIAALADAAYAAPNGTINVLVLGGSLGARVFSDIVPDAIAALPPDLRARLSITQQCRVEDLGRVRQAYKTSGVRAELAPFFTDVAVRLGEAHLVIARAGASTCAELAIAGRPAILVPLPSAIDDHQSANAGALARAGGAIVTRQSELTSDGLARQMQALLENCDALARMAQAIRSAAHKDAAGTLADLIEKHALQEGVRT